MTFPIVLSFAILILALAAFASEIFRIEFVALCILASILALGSVLGVTPQEAISGFSNTATITVMAMFVLSYGIYRSGLIEILARHVIRLAGKGEVRQLIAIMLSVGPMSMFINNTAAVAILIPLVIALARKYKRSPSKLLMPLSFFSQLGGVVTLIGTSTNILASSLADEMGYGPFSMFEFSKIGVFVFFTGALYILLIGRKMLPERKTKEAWEENLKNQEYLCEIIVKANFQGVAKPLEKAGLREKMGLEIVEIRRDDRKLKPTGEFVLETGDVLLVRAKLKQIVELENIQGLAIEREWRFGYELDPEKEKEKDSRIWEVVIGPTSRLIGDTIEEANFRDRYHCIVIGVQKKGHLIKERFDNIRLRFGDSLLLKGPLSSFEKLARDRGFILTEEVAHKAFRKAKMLTAISIVVGVVGVASLGVPILVTSVVGCVLMRLTGCLDMDEFLSSIRWDVILLLAGVIPMGLAMQKTGAAQLIADFVARIGVHVPPIVVVGIFYLTTTILTELLSNNASVVVLVPVAVATAKTIGIQPKALILAVMFAASTSFCTPVGYQTNTMVYGPGGYRFLDYLKVGGPLNLFLAVVTPIYIMIFWGL